ncbi:ferritin-like domain-containing protein [Pseudomaricurvus sp.]|uniref:ferritin-like domain-containing protein n=1 Tax=Pseudomaricurvus sp. TaxID=2004510 RepID=UPI003F6B7F3A
MKADNVNSIIKVLNGGIEFYESAIEKVENPDVIKEFKSMALARKNAVVKLQPFAKLSDGERETGRSASVKVREMYTDILGVVSTDKDFTYIKQLEEVEDKTLDEIRDAMEEIPEPLYASTLGEVYQEMKDCHDHMRHLQKLAA